MQDALVGKTLGSCLIVRLLRAGKQCALYEGQHTRLRRSSVLKVLRPEHAAHPECVRAFQQAALDLAAKVPAPNQPNAFNVGEAEGIHFVELNMDAGEDLDQGCLG